MALKPFKMLRIFTRYTNFLQNLYETRSTDKSFGVLKFWITWEFLAILCPKITKLSKLVQNGKENHENFSISKIWKKVLFVLLWTCFVQIGVALAFWMFRGFFYRSYKFLIAKCVIPSCQFWKAIKSEPLGVRS